MKRRYFRRGEQIWRFVTDDGETRAFVRIVGSVNGWVGSVSGIEDMDGQGIREIPEEEGEPS